MSSVRLLVTTSPAEVPVSLAASLEAAPGRAAQPWRAVPPVGAQPGRILPAGPGVIRLSAGGGARRRAA